jgi:hypothetical protein
MKCDNAHLKAQLIIAMLVTVLGVGLFIAGFIVPPLGIIDGSVLIAGGEAFTFVGALVGVDYTYRFKSKFMEYGNN